MRNGVEIQVKDGIRVRVTGPFYYGCNQSGDSQYFMRMKIHEGDKFPEEPLIDIEVGAPNEPIILCLFEQCQCTDILNAGFGIDVSSSTLAIDSWYLDEPVSPTPCLTDYSFTQEIIDGLAHTVLKCNGSPLLVLGPGGLTVNKTIELSMW